jgi:hypothetical protein
MPNWTINRLVVEGSPDDLADFRERVRGTDETGTDVEFLLASLVPEPDPDVLEQVKTDGSVDLEEVRTRGGNSWRLAKWGTKWDVSNATVETTPEKVIFSFWTAWSAPLAWVRAVSGLFPGLLFKLEYQDEDSDEEMEGIYIQCHFRDGEVSAPSSGAITGILTAVLELWMEDPWLYFFFDHPHELANASTIMSGPAPEEIEDWVEFRKNPGSFREKLLRDEGFLFETLGLTLKESGQVTEET